MPIQTQDTPVPVEKTPSPEQTPDDKSIAPAPRLRLPFLDGIRGFAALYVCLFHIRAEWSDNLSPVMSALTAPLHYGHEAVCLFIVLSGFCLMLPFVHRSTNPAVSWQSIRQFIQRRAHRIFPGYYSALIFSILLNVFSVQVIKAVVKWDFSALDRASLFPDLTVPNVAYHVFLLHNLLNGSSHFQNYPLWSIAMEWQIYFFFILLLLPLWQRIGISGTVLTAFIISLIPHYFFPPVYNLDWTFPWLLALFAFGMAAAQISLTPVYQVKPWNKPKNWAIVGVIAAFAVIIIRIFTEGSPPVHWVWLTDIFAGIASVSLILFSTQRTLQGRHKSGLVQFLESKIALFLGAMSYSLYLTHKIFLMKIGAFIVPLMNKLPIPSDGKVVFFFVTCVPLTVGLSYLFYRAFEKPFLPKAGKIKVIK